MFGSWMLRRLRRTALRPALEALDRRDVPATLYPGPFGHRPFITMMGPGTPFRSAPRPVAPSDGFAPGSGTPLGTQGPRGPINYFAAPRPTQALATGRPGTFPGNVPFGAGGYYSIVNTPGGPAGLRGLRLPALTVARPVAVAPAALTAPGQAVGATSPGDFPFGPGGYYSIINTPGGPAGLR